MEKKREKKKTSMLSNLNGSLLPSVRVTRNKSLNNIKLYFSSFIFFIFISR